MGTRILVINPGSISTKIAVYDDTEPLFVESIEYKKEELSKYAEILEQLPMRINTIFSALVTHDIDLKSINVIVARGGLLPPVKSGAYKVNEDMVYQLKYQPQNEHASNLGAIIADSISQDLGIDAYVYDPVTVDELEPIARITGLPEMERKGMGHNLNMRASAIKYAERVGKPYKELSLIVVHLGGGITLSLHKCGRMIDMISDDEGPFSPERAGGLPVFQVIKMATSPEYDYKKMMKKVRRYGGLNAYFGTTDAKEIESRIVNGDDKAALIYEALAHNVAKNIGKLAVVVSGKLDAIILTGGIAYSSMLTGWIKERVEFIAPVVMLPGENEMEALALGVLRVVKGVELSHVFVRDNV
ncbi:MAG: butyrate kinase [Firmicutes bacterium]|nr:butyrate kinase [Bacillota bacterium]